MFIELAKKRRSIKVYTAQPVEPEKVQAIIESALRAPSGRAARPCSFIVVNDKKLLEKLSVAKPMGAQFIKDVSVAIIVCADPSQSHLWIEDCTIAAVSIQYVTWGRRFQNDLWLNKSVQNGSVQNVSTRLMRFHEIL